MCGKKDKFGRENIINNREYGDMENLTIEVYCKRCNIIVSGSRVCLRCPHCDQIMDYIRIMRDIEENIEYQS